MKTVILKDKKFIPYITEKSIAEAIELISEKINIELKDDFPLFLVVLNGSFMFAADLLRKITIPCDISFIKVASYHGVSSTGSITELIGLTENVKGRLVVIIEDIVDTGTTLEKLYNVLYQKEVKDVKIASLLLKPEAYKKEIPVNYVGIEITNEFVVGYGLDYDGLGRNLKEIYVLDA